MESKKRSACWNEFTEGIDPIKGTPHMICCHCKAVKPHPNQNANKSTTILLKHLDTCIPYLRIKRERLREHSNTLTNVWDLASNRSEDWTTTGAMTDEKLREQVLRIIVAGNLSFSQAENQELQKLLHHAYPGVAIPNRRSVVACLEENVKEARTRLKKDLADIDSQIHLAIDCWSARGIQHQAFIGTFSPKLWFKLKCNVNIM